MTGMVTASMIPTIISGSDIRATPPAFRMSAGTRSSAITATAPASSAIFAWSGVTTSMITPPLSIWARPFLVAQVEVSTVIQASPSLGSTPGRSCRPRRGAIGPSAPIIARDSGLPARPPGRRLGADSVAVSAAEGLEHSAEQPDSAFRGGRGEPAHRVDQRDHGVVVECAQEREEAQDRVVLDLRQEAEAALEFTRLEARYEADRAIEQPDEDE